MLTMKAVILAAGLGSRLLPHTELRPKCLLKIGGHTILEYQVAALRQCGITDMGIVLGYQGEKIRAHLNTPVTYFENTEYASTGSSYSLWIARDFIRDGFVYVNSDLIFHPRMLQMLLDTPEPDGIIIDRDVDLTGDMQKAHMDGARILRMSKSMPAETAAAEVVGPAKFSADGARELVAYLDDLVNSGERTRWAYEAFAEVAARRPFVGIDNPGCFWAEVDTPGDLIEASQRIPSHFIEFRAPRLTTLEQPDERRVWDINRHPIAYMDRLLNSKLAPAVQHLPGSEDHIRSVLLGNRASFTEKLRTLDIQQLSPPAIHRALERRLLAIESQLGRTYDPASLSRAAALDEVLADVLTLCPSDVGNGFVITESCAVRMLEELPPPALMAALGHPSLPSLLREENPLDVVAMCRTTEDNDWQARYKQLLAAVTVDDFERRPIRFFVADTPKYRPAFINSKHPPKLWRISHNKEAGVITCLTLEEPVPFKVPLLQYLIVFIHYFFEAGFASRFYESVARADGRPLGEEIVDSIYSHTQKLTFFYSNVYSENLFWDRALEVFAGAFDSDDVRFFSGCADCGEYVPSSGAEDAVVSLNLIDHIWNLNFLGHGVGVDTFQHDTIYFLYHFRGALWQRIVNELTGIDRGRMEELIVRHLGIGDAALTGRLLTASKPQLV
jgi:L-glutamine-phosphate cytidylyltransferase